MQNYFSNQTSSYKQEYVLKFSHYNAKEKLTQPQAMLVLCGSSSQYLGLVCSMWSERRSTFLGRAMH